MTRELYNMHQNDIHSYCLPDESEKENAYRREMIEHTVADTKD
jgi:hypothetical protein